MQYPESQQFFDMIYDSDDSDNHDIHDCNDGQILLVQYTKGANKVYLFDNEMQNLMRGISSDDRKKSGYCEFPCHEHCIFGDFWNPNRE